MMNTFVCIQESNRTFFFCVFLSLLVFELEGVAILNPSRTRVKVAWTPPGRDGFYFIRIFLSYLIDIINEKCIEVYQYFFRQFLTKIVDVFPKLTNIFNSIAN